MKLLLRIYLFIHPINKLPKNLIHFLVGLDSFTKYNRNLKNNTLPLSLTYMKFCFESLFSHSVDFLPDTLTHLELPSNYSQPVNRLPKSLTHLKLPLIFNEPLTFLPDTLTCLVFYYGSVFSQSLDNLPQTLKKIVLPTNFPSNISTLHEHIEFIEIFSSKRTDDNFNFNLNVLINL